MKIVDLAEQAARAVNPSAASLGGFNIQNELRKTLRKSLKSIEPRLRAYTVSKSSVQSKIDRWSAESYERKMEEVVQAAIAGDTAVAAELEAGNGPSKETFDRLCGAAWRELEQHERDHRELFAQAAELIEAPMHAVVTMGQSILDSTLDSLDVPRFTLQGATNGVGDMVRNLQNAGRGETANLQTFWETLG